MIYAAASLGVAIGDFYYAICILLEFLYLWLFCYILCEFVTPHDNGFFDFMKTLKIDCITDIISQMTLLALD